MRSATSESRRVSWLVWVVMAFVLFAVTILPGRIAQVGSWQLARASTAQAEDGAAAVGEDEVLRSISLSSQTASPCGCKDAKDILYRIKEASAAINAFKVEIQKMEAKEKSSGNPVMFSNDVKEQTLVPQIQVWLNWIRSAEPEPKPASPEMRTDPHSCNISTVRKGTPCLEEAEQHHEAVHKARCDAVTSTKEWKESSNFFSDYRSWSGMRLAAYAQEEIDAYQQEIDYLLRILATLPASCSQKGWSGVITYTEVYVKTLTTSRPGSNPGQRPSIGFEVTQSIEELSNESISYWATLSLLPAGNAPAAGGQDAFVTAEVREYYRHQFKEVRKIACHVTGTNVPVEKVGSAEESTERNGDGSFTGKIRVHVSSSDFSFEKPEIQYTTTKSTTSTVNGCGESGAPKTPAGPESVPSVSHSEGLGTAIKPNPGSPNVMSGNQTAIGADHRTRMYTWALVRK